MTSRGFICLCAAVVLAAGCFSPVAEPGDGGAGGGGGGAGGGATGGGGGGAGGGAMGGGAGGGSGQPCLQASDCGTEDAGVGFCGTFTGFSCVDLRCLKECAPPRNCNTDLDAGCVTCFSGDAGVISTKSCRASLCQGLTAQGRVETSSCTTWPGTLDAMPGATVQLSGAQCRYAFVRGNGVQVGTVNELSDGTFLADFPSMGGACTGSRLPTGVERWAFSCDACQFIVAFF